VSRMFLCLGLGFLAAAAAAALYGYGTVLGEPAPAGQVGAFVFLGLAVATLGAGVLTRGWERTDRAERGRRTGRLRRDSAPAGEQPGAASPADPAPGPVGDPGTSPGGKSRDPDSLRRAG
jgi:hypothetical protein